MTTPIWYNAALMLLKPIYRLKIKQRAKSEAEYQQECRERFGPFEPAKCQGAIWFHAVSVGETNAAEPLIQHYLEQGFAVLLTNTTKTGQARAKALFLKAPYLDQFQAVYLPIDQRHLILQFLNLYRPRLLLLVETELWPNLLDQVKQQQIPALLLNARLSEKSAQGYAKLKRLTAAMLQQLDFLLAQDSATLARFDKLGLDPKHAQVVGNIKFDLAIPATLLDHAQALTTKWQLDQRQIATIASTHAPEEQQLLSEFAKRFSSDPLKLCIVVPRHPERFDEVFALCQQLGLVTHRRSLKQSIQPDTQVYLADSMGELWLWYAISQVCFVGGSLNQPGGGHNILEPIALNVATVIGPRYFNFQHIVDQLVEQDAIKVAQNSEQVIDFFATAFDRPEQLQQQIEQAATLLTANQGSLHRHIKAIDRYLEK